MHTTQLAPIIEAIMLRLDEHYYVLKDANIDTTTVSRMVRSCEKLVANYQTRKYNCADCFGTINAHDDDCQRPF